MKKIVYSSHPTVVKLEPPDLFLASLFVGWLVPLFSSVFLHGLRYFSSKISPEFSGSFTRTGRQAPAALQGFGFTI